MNYIKYLRELLLVGVYVLGFLGIVATGENVGEGLNLLTDANATMQFTSVQEIGLGPDDISLEIQDLPYMWGAQVVRGTPYDDTQPPGPMGLPAHIQAGFTPTDDTATQAPAPVMYIIPVVAYKALWDEAGNAAVSGTTAQIFQFASVLPFPGPISGLPVLPFEQVGGTNDLAVRQGHVPANLASATKDGYRFVGRFAQDANPVTNKGLQYIYQGFTSDAEYLIAFFAPVRTDALVNSAGEVAQDEQDRFNADYSGYMQERAAMLNGLDSTAWQPDLARLDALVASLTINGMSRSRCQIPNSFTSMVENGCEYLYTRKLTLKLQKPATIYPLCQDSCRLELSNYFSIMAVRRLI